MVTGWTEGSIRASLAEAALRQQDAEQALGLAREVRAGRGEGGLRGRSGEGGPSGAALRQLDAEQALGSRGRCGWGGGAAPEVTMEEDLRWR